MYVVTSHDSVVGIYTSKELAEKARRRVILGQELAGALIGSAQIAEAPEIDVLPSHPMGEPRGHKVNGILVD